MVHKVFSIFDNKAKMYNVPFFMNTEGQATREFTDLVNDKQSRISKHPGDYELVLIGLFDDMTGELDGVEHKTIAVGDQYVKEN